MLSVTNLERWMRTAQDVKKEFVYEKSTGTWQWVDRDERDIAEAYHGPFSTFYEALEESVAPYFEPGESA